MVQILSLSLNSKELSFHSHVHSFYQYVLRDCLAEVQVVSHLLSTKSSVRLPG
eukprot:c5952_g1_i2 orf=186-344(+)